MHIHVITFRLYELLVMPFGLTNAPANEWAIRTLLKSLRIGFFDDILVSSLSLEEHAHYLASMLEKLFDHKLYANIKKYEFGKN